MWCPTANCPAQEYLLAQTDVFDVIGTNEKSSADAPPEIHAVYKLKLETEDIGNKFIKVYKKSQQICNQCLAQHEKLIGS